tara:strand:- start:235 stop:393 length:159 start_codon:yes stop_codon:yes gene_type:complete
MFLFSSFLGLMLEKSLIINFPIKKMSDNTKNTISIPFKRIDISRLRLEILSI